MPKWGLRWASKGFHMVPNSTSNIYTTYVPLEADDAAVDPRVAVLARLDCEQRPLDRLQHQQRLLFSEMETKQLIFILSYY